MKSEQHAEELDLVGHAPSRLRIQLSAGALVQHADGVFRITEVLDFDSVVAVNAETGRTKVLRIGELRQMDTATPVETNIDADAIADEDWEVANERYQAIKPLLDAGENSRKAVVERAKQVNVDAATLYRWLSRYRAMDAVSALIPFKRGWKTGNYRLGASAEGVIREVIKDFFLKRERPSAQKAVREVHRLCDARNIQRPSGTAVRARIARIPEYERLAKRGQAELARQRFVPKPGKYPGADYPLAVVQVDHTRLDVMLVDDIHRKPMDRPWLTVAIDVFSRMTVGYYLSLDAPSVTSVAMCLSHAMLPKEEWLLLHGVEGQWPVWGRPAKVHADNGPDFRSDTLRRSSKLYGIDLEFRPVKQPRYGAHIERLQGTLLHELHDLPGTTFSSIKERGEYDSEKHAVMTRDEVERQLLELICNEYHRRRHSALGMPPLRMWEFGVFGGPGIQGVGLPARPADRETVVIDFLPIFDRTVQVDGVSIDNLRYYAECLRPWIGAEDPTTGETRKHIFRRDPRDVTCVHFFDPDLKQYFKVPLADQSIPPFSEWEHRRAKAELNKAGHDPSDEKAVFRSIATRRAMVDESAAKTKKARKEAQRRADHLRKRTPDLSPPPEPAVADVATAPAPAMSTKPVTRQASGLLSNNVRATDDIA